MTSDKSSADLENFSSLGKGMVLLPRNVVVGAAACGLKTGVVRGYVTKCWLRRPDIPWLYQDVVLLKAHNCAVRKRFDLPHRRLRAIINRNQSRSRRCKTHLKVHEKAPNHWFLLFRCLSSQMRKPPAAQYCRKCIIVSHETDIWTRIILSWREQSWFSAMKGKLLRAPFCTTIVQMRNIQLCLRNLVWCEVKWIDHGKPHNDIDWSLSTLSMHYF